jgi:acyl-CoA reductase-like NAD-dependent aldehyde dehydrogenase
MGKELAPIVSARLGKLLLELGGNNAAIVCPSANLDLNIKGNSFFCLWNNRSKMYFVKKIICS